MSDTHPLLSPVTFAALAMPNRVVMAPMTRTRAQADHVPGDLMVEYYRQRADAGLIITECAMVDPSASAYINDPGICDAAQIAGWKRVTDAVHAEGGRIMLQIWHPGRVTHPAINAGAIPVSSSDRPMSGEVRTPSGKQPYVAPRRLAAEELPAYVEQFVQAARHAMDAGFDGVQVHGAHGYLIDQFLRDSVNDRHDAYGGSIENRARFLFEVVDAVIAAVGASRVALRVSPLVPFNEISDSEPTALLRYVASEFDRRGGAFFELRHDDHTLPAERAMAQLARARLAKTPLMLNGGYTPAAAAADVASGLADAISFARPYIANPDLVVRIAGGAPLAEVDFSTVYAGGAQGYTDYPRWAA